MKGFKRYFLCVTALFIFALSMVQPVHAASNTDAIVSALRSGITVKGQTVKIPASYINQAENFFASHKITDRQARYILAEVNGAKAAIQKAGVTDLKKMDQATKNRVLASAQAAANDIDLKLTIGPNKNVQIADSEGAVAFTSDNVIKTTGPAWSLPLWAVGWAGGFLWIMTVCLFLIRKFRLMEQIDS